MTQFQVLAHSRTAQVQITVFHTQVIPAVGIVLDGKRRSLCRIQHGQPFHCDFHLTRRQVGILAGTFVHRTLYLNDILTAQVTGLFAKFCVHVRVKHQLGDTVTVAEVNKSHTSHLAYTLYPSGQRHALSCISDSQFAACMISEHIFNLVFFFAQR